MSGEERVEEMTRQINVSIRQVGIGDDPQVRAPENRCIAVERRTEVHDSGGCQAAHFPAYEVWKRVDMAVFHLFPPDRGQQLAPPPAVENDRYRIRSNQVAKMLQGGGVQMADAFGRDQYDIGMLCENGGPCGLENLHISVAQRLHEFQLAWHSTRRAPDLGK
jgi:hypothetical protein